MIFTTYEPEAVNELALIPLFAGMMFAAAAGAVYGIGSRWWESLLGVAFFGIMIASALPIAVVLGRRLFDKYPGYEWVALGVYSLWALSWVAMLIIILVERRRAPVSIYLSRSLKERQHR